MARYHKNSVRGEGRGCVIRFASYESVQFHSIKSALFTEQATVLLNFFLASKLRCAARNLDRGHAEGCKSLGIFLDGNFQWELL